MYLIQNYNRSFESQNGLTEETSMIQNQLDLLHSNLFKIIKPALRDNKTRNDLFLILFNLLKRNRGEDQAQG